MIFVTGATGLVGRHVLQELRERHLPAIALVRDEHSAESMRRLGAVPIHGDVTDASTWGQLVDCSAIVHAAALVIAQAPWSAYQRLNVDSVSLAAARARLLGIPMIHISSVAVYKRVPYDAPPGTVDEAFPLGPVDSGGFYARSKRLAERALWEEVGRGLQAIAIRPCVIYGEGDRQFLPRISAVARKGWLPLIGAGNRPLALVHARSVALAVARALQAREAWGRAYNITNDDSITAREFIACLSEGLGRRVRPVRIPLPAALVAARLGDGLLRLLARWRGQPSHRLQGAVRYWHGGNPYTSEAARAALGWAPRVAHRAALPLAVRAAMAEGHNKGPEIVPGPSASVPLGW